VNTEPPRHEPEPPNSCVDAPPGRPSSDVEDERTRRVREATEDFIRRQQQ
jgi:hypothetical protein